MNHNRLLLLGLLKTQEQHGYQLMDFIDRNLSHITNIKKATAYYELNRLEKAGLISARMEQDEGRPPRKVYTLTPKGERAYLQLLRQSLAEIDPPTCGTDIGLMLMDTLDRQEARVLLQQKVERLRQSLMRYEKAPCHHQRSSVGLAIGHITARLKAEIQWFEDLIRHLEGDDRVGE